MKINPYDINSAGQEFTANSFIIFSRSTVLKLIHAELFKPLWLFVYKVKCQVFLSITTLHHVLSLENFDSMNYVILWHHLRMILPSNVTFFNQCRINRSTKSFSWKYVGRTAEYWNSFLARICKKYFIIQRILDNKILSNHSLDGISNPIATS